MHLDSKGAVVALAAMFALAEYAEIARAEGASVFARCANQVGAQYKGEGRWQLYGTGHGLAQEQNFYNCIDAHTTGQASSSEPAVSRHHVPVKRHAAQVPPKRSFEEIHADRSMLSGSESRIAAINFVNANCSSGPLPEVRVVTAPNSGDVRMEPTKYAVSRSKSDTLFRCNGNIVDAVAVFYKSKSDFAGADKVVLDVDFKVGIVRRYIFAINIR